MTQTSFSGPVVSKDKFVTGISAVTSGTAGIVPTVRRISTSADGIYAPISLPPCHIISMWANVEVAHTATAQAGIRVGTSADADLYGSKGVSAVNTYDITPSAISLLSLASGANLVVDVTTVGTAGDGQASVYVMYMQT